MDDHAPTNRIENIAPFHDGFAELTRLLMAPAAQLLGEDAYLFKEKINFKKPGGGGFEPHQDSQAGWDRYASNFINVMLCLDEETVENGCVEFTPGQNPGVLLRGMEPLTAEDTKDMTFVAFPTRPGDLVFFDAYMPHRSAANQTASQRRLYFATYSRAPEGDHLAQYYADKRKPSPRTSNGTRTRSTFTRCSRCPFFRTVGSFRYRPRRFFGRVPLSRIGGLAA